MRKLLVVALVAAVLVLAPASVGADEPVVQPPPRGLLVSHAAWSCGDRGVVLSVRVVDVDDDVREVTEACVTVQHRTRLLDCGTRADRLAERSKNAPKYPRDGAVYVGAVECGLEERFADLFAR